jgi:hypothetical protein
MTEDDASVRKVRKIAADDPEFSVRIASITDLRRLLTEAKEAKFSASWSSEGALLQQVNPAATAIICPLFRNGGSTSEPESYRCHLWFVSIPDDERIVSLIDVTKDSLQGLPEAADPVQLRKVIRVLLDGSHLAALA